ncbi:hypothetical protein FB45DRAFT_1092902 [Roridomyces roridus]|uniref:Uncharacterized protein n=1 Tax=Roridomyces roridus TaxID=1738132 RepID=A0AAD7BHZ8_9AGAR|nr:hypothetical protein FB45DRAFT_1092902 [Roridomyces roridus]
MAVYLGFNPRLLLYAVVDWIRGFLGVSLLFVKAIGRPAEFAFLNTPRSYPRFVTMFAQGQTPFLSALNLINLGVLYEIMNARPGRRLRDALCPVLLVVNKGDDLATATEIARLAPDKITLVEAQGGHFDIMEGGKVGFISACVSTQWFSPLVFLSQHQGPAGFFGTASLRSVKMSVVLLLVTTVRQFTPET